MHPTTTSPQTLFDNNPGKSLRSRALDLLRFPLAMAVVIDHILGFPGLLTYLNNSIAYAEMNAVQITYIVVDTLITGFSVPMFFLISGYLFFLNSRFSATVYLQKMKSRFKSLFIPYVAWNTLAVIIAAAMAYISIRHGFDIQPPEWSVSTVLQCFWDRAKGPFPDMNSVEATPADIPLWFVKVLIILAISTPIIYLLIRKMGIIFPIILGMVWLAVEHSEYPNTWEWITGAFFFSWGAWISICKKDISDIFTKHRRVWLIIFPLLSILALILNFSSHELYLPLKRINILLSVPFIYNLSIIAIERFHAKENRFLGNAAFFIYAGHYLVHSSIVVLLGKVWVPVDGTGAVVFLTAVMLLTLALLLATYWLMRRYTPRLLGVFTGGRL